MILVGITGAIGHGKSSLAAALQTALPNSMHLESFYLIAEVADALHQQLTLTSIPSSNDTEAINNWLQALPGILQDKVGRKIDFKQIAISRLNIAKNPVLYQKLFQHLDNLKANPEMAKAKITDKNKSVYRPILQWVGGYVVDKLGSSAWWDELIRRADLALKDGKELVILGGVRYPSDAQIVQAAGGKIIHVVRPEIPETDIVDPTERERAKIKADITVINNGSLDDLLACARRVLADTHNHRRATTYTATTVK